MTNNNGNSGIKLPILVAEDDPNAAILLHRAFLKNGISNPVYICPNGEDALDYLCGRNRYLDRSKYAFPEMIFLDIKMPRKSGFEVLEWLQAHTDCAIIPKMVMSDSRQREDVKRAYRLGANAYFRKPSGFLELVELVRVIYLFWSACEKFRITDEGCKETVTV